MNFLFHLFRFHCGPATLVRGHDLVSLVLIFRSFKDFSKGLLHFENWFFLVTSILLEAHATTCAIGDKVEGIFVEFSPKNWMEQDLFPDGKYDVRLQREWPLSKRVVYE